MPLTSNWFLGLKKPIMSAVLMSKKATNEIVAQKIPMPAILVDIRLVRPGIHFPNPGQPSGDVVRNKRVRVRLDGGPSVFE